MPLASALLPVQRAIFAALTADATLPGKVVGIFDQVPDGTGFPYIVIGEATEALADTQDHDGRDITCTLHVWSQAKGFTECLSLAQDLNRILHHQILPLVGASWIYCSCELLEPMHDPDGITRHAVLQYRLFVQIP